MAYATGHVKHNIDTNQVALRTIFDEEGKGWIVSTPHRGASFLRTSDVESWDDLFVPE